VSAIWCKAAKPQGQRGDIAPVEKGRSSGNIAASMKRIPIMLDIKKLEIEYVTNGAGEKTAVIVPIDSFEELMEDIVDLAAAAERREEPGIPHEQLLTDLEQGGLL
jgi:hypothetical protein